jgi:hypothetical protein
MCANARHPAAGGPGALPDPVIVQVLVDLKSADPTAHTADEAIRHLLGFGEKLATVRRSVLHELVLTEPEERAEDAPSSTVPGAQEVGLVGLLSAYLEQTVVFWNSNKHRAWVRSTGPNRSVESWEATRRGRRRIGPFGAPDLADGSRDHVLLWNRGQGSEPPDLAPALRPWRLRAYGCGELYSLEWRTDQIATRLAWTEQVAVVRSRSAGLLVNPHYQDHRILQGAVPLPLWG